MKGEVVKGVLKKHGVNIRDLAARLGMTNQNVSQLLGKQLGKRCEVVRSSCDVVAKFIFAL